MRRSVDRPARIHSTTPKLRRALAREAGTRLPRRAPSFGHSRQSLALCSAISALKISSMVSSATCSRFSPCSRRYSLQAASYSVFVLATRIRRAKRSSVINLLLVSGSCAGSRPAVLGGLLERGLAFDHPPLLLPRLAVLRVVPGVAWRSVITNVVF